MAEHISGTHLTSLQDAEAVRAIVPLGMRYHFPTIVVHARDFRMQAAPGNLILIGHKKGNPWIELFEPRMCFRYDYVPSDAGFRAVLINAAPRAGEEEQYVVEYEKMDMRFSPTCPNLWEKATPCSSPAPICLR